MRLAFPAIAMALLFADQLRGQTPALPERRANALVGSEFAQSIAHLPLTRREQRIQREILAGNVPYSLHQLCPVSVTNIIGGKTNSATFFVTPDYLAVGTDEDSFYTPLTPMTAQSIADRLDCVLPTRKMVDSIYASAQTKVAPLPIPPSAAMTSVAVFQQHNAMVQTQRVAALKRPPPGTLIAGHKKDVVISPRLAANIGKVAIYGWHQTNRQPIQPLYLGHTNTWVDYSHGIRLVQQRMILNGETTTVAKVLADPKFAELLSDEGVITTSRYPTNLALSKRAEFQPSDHFGERIADFGFDPQVRIQINAPPAEDFASNKPVCLILYALPNGNTTEQTIGKTLQPGDDWHFDIQHIGAQTRFLRAILTNQIIVTVYLETEMKSWPAWRRQHGDKPIPDIIARVKAIFPTNRMEVVLTGHSGGGSFTFGYLNTQEKIPDEVKRIAFLDSNYGYETTNHFGKLTDWLKASPKHSLCVLAYHDSIALLDGKTFVSERGGTWGRSQAMLTDFNSQFSFNNQTNAAGLRIHTALGGRLQLLLKENPDKKILHTVQVERNGFIHTMLIGTPFEGKGYEYFGERAYSPFIQTE